MIDQTNYPFLIPMRIVLSSASAAPEVTVKTPGFGVEVRGIFVACYDSAKAVIPTDSAREPLRVQILWQDSDNKMGQQAMDVLQLGEYGKSDMFKPFMIEANSNLVLTASADATYGTNLTYPLSIDVMLACARLAPGGGTVSGSY